LAVVQSASRPGEWTDDTAMALALADSLAANDGLDERDLIQRFVLWQEQGFVHRLPRALI
jgi:ADP-ribosylglycohydrolase